MHPEPGSVILLEGTLIHPDDREEPVMVRMTFGDRVSYTIEPKEPDTPDYETITHVCGLTHIRQGADIGPLEQASHVGWSGHLAQFHPYHEMRRDANVCGSTCRGLVEPT